jgi:hypothetical protein
MKRFPLGFALVPVLLMVASFFAGCTFTQQQVVPLAQKTVRQYCAIPEADRLLIRQQVNAAITPDAIVVTCADSPTVGAAASH